MKRLLILMMMIAPLLGMAQKSPVDKLFEKYANKEGFTTVSISGALLKFASKMDNSKESESKVISSLDGIRILSVDDEELNEKVNFYEELKADGFFKNNNYEVLMEVTEKDQIVRFYGYDAGNGKLSELLLVVGGKDDNSLISIRGMIDPDQIGKITNSLNLDIDVDVDDTKIKH